MQKITPFLWFDDNAEEAVKFYVSVFKNSKVGKVARYGKAGPGKEGTVMTIAFELAGQEFVALNAGPRFKFTEAISFVVNCETQKEVDEFWEKLSAGGEKVQCGWLKDKFGLSWQVVPTELEKMLSDSDSARSQRVMKAMLQMAKLDIATLKRAYEGNIADTGNHTRGVGGWCASPRIQSPSCHPLRYAIRPSSPTSPISTFSNSPRQTAYKPASRWWSSPQPPLL